MKDLDLEYKNEIQTILNDIITSEEHSAYLETEEDEQYQALRAAFEPRIEQLHRQVSTASPMQIIALEKTLLNEELEGLYLSKLLGYSVLRGEVSDQLKYLRPQDHFKDILLAICNSANFEHIKARISQVVQVGFALSSDIWITNLINSNDNKKVKYFLQSMKKPELRVESARKSALARFKRQFKDNVFYYAEIPQVKAELSKLYPEFRNFIEIRVKLDKVNDNLKNQIIQFLNNKEFHGTMEHTTILGLASAFLELNADDKKNLTEVYNTLRNSDSEFSDMHLDFILTMRNRDVDLDNKADNNISSMIDKSINDDISDYYKLMDIVHGKGYVHRDAVDAARTFYNSHEGLSKINTCVRSVIYAYFKRAIINLEETEYPIFMELLGATPASAQSDDVVTEEGEESHDSTKRNLAIPVYMEIFSNQQFNQNIKDLSMIYVRKLLRFHTDKRGKDYQDIKKFVSATFIDLGFLNSKQSVELFKSKRKKKAVAK